MTRSDTSRHLSADAVSATARPTLVVEAAVRSRNSLAATALRFGVGSCESSEGDWWVGWWLADCIVGRQVSGLKTRQKLTSKDSSDGEEFSHFDRISR
jgi:hypothetical protein